MTPKKTTLSLLLLLPTFIVLLLLGALYTPTINAIPDDTLTVTNTNDNGSGSLRQAIINANSGDTIDFNISGTILLENQLVINKNLTINGSGNITINGNNATRVFMITNGNVTFNSLSIINGNDQSVDCSGFSCGGGILIQSNSITVTITNSTITGNLADYGGGLYNFGTVIINDSSISNNLGTNSSGAIYNLGTAIISGSTISNNSAEVSGCIANTGMMIINNSSISNNSATGGNGGGLSNFGGGTITINDSAISGNSAVYYSGGISNYSIITINNSTISNNSADYSGGIHNNGTITLSNSTISNNSARNGIGGGFYNDYHDTSTISSSTISNNSATNHGGGIFNTGIMTINSSTITDNRTETAGGGISSYGDTYASTTVTNTIISGNVISDTTTPNDLSLCGGIVDTFISGGNNLIGTVQVEIIAFNVTGDQTNVNDPKLNDLSNNGGKTFTHALQFDSSAIDSGANCNATDQRGYTRPQDGDGDGNAICDIGAYEYIAYTEFIFLPVVVK